MSGKIDEAQVRRVALLARLEMSDQEVHQFSDQLSSILEYIEKLNELDTENVEPLAHCLDVHNAFRADEIRESLGAEKSMTNAPDREGDYFKVPKVLDDGAGSL